MPALTISTDDTKSAGSLPALGWAAVVVAIAVAASPLSSGYFSFTVWGPLALGAMALLAVVAWTARTMFTRYGLVAWAGLGALLALSAASMLWADSKDSTWTAVNRLALYTAVFAIVLLALRNRRTARLIVLILGSAALISCLVLDLSFLFGSGQGAFVARRLNSPIGYINGTAGLLVMGVWPWIGCAETAARRLLRAGALGAATLIAGTFVLTESRALIPATVISAMLVLLCAPGRTRRAVNLIVIGVSVGLGLPWTLAVYSTGGAADRLLAPSRGDLRLAAGAILLSALGAGAVRYAVDALAARAAPETRQAARRWLRRTFIAGAAVLAVGAAVFGGPFVSREYRSFTALRVNENASVRFIDAGGFRYDLWRVALHEFTAHPLGGLGAGNYDSEYYRLRRNPEYVTQPHSLELQMAAELGIGGILALVLFAGAVLGAGFARRGTLASGDRLIKIAALGMFTAWFVDTSVDWLYDIPGLTGIALVAAALLVVPASGAPEPAKRTRRGRTAVVLGLGALALVAVLAASVGRQYAATLYANSGSSEIGRSPRAAIGTLRTAEQLDPFSVSTLYSLAAAYARLDDYQHARDALLVAAAREPLNYVPPALLGDLALRRGAYRVALAEYRRALALNPNDPELLQSQGAALAAAR